MSLRLKILALAILPLLAAVVLVTMLVTSQSRNLTHKTIAAFEQSTLDMKKKELQSYMQLALTAIDHIYAHAGPDDEAAKTAVKKILRALRYGDEGYFFAYDYSGIALVDPIGPEREGKNNLDLKDSTGKPVAYQLIQAARNGGGFVEYLWRKPEDFHATRKVSYAVGLHKWEWMIGTGVYLDDMTAHTAAAKRDLTHSINRTFLFVGGIAVPLLIFVFLAGMAINLRERRMADDKLKELTQRVINTQEEERKRIARELHDGISQHLVGIRYVLDLARRKARNGDPEALHNIERGADGLNVAIKEVRRISHDLRPGVLDDLGLAAALEGLTHSFTERTGIPVRFRCARFTHTLTPDMNTALYRVAQEALTNIERHARARNVYVTLVSGKTGMTMRIADNGHGIYAGGRLEQLKSAGGLGLRNMQERMSHFNGTLTLETGTDGTTLTARLPVNSSGSKAREKASA